MNEDCKPRKVALTSVWSHHQEKVKYPNQQERVLQILKGKILTSRQIHCEMCKTKSLDLSSARRAVTNLIDQTKIVVDRLDKCNVTGKTVKFYKLPCETLF